MNKMKIKFGVVLFVLLIFCGKTSLSAKDDKFKAFLNLSTGNFSAFVFGGGADITIYKFFSIKPSIDFASIGGRILYFDGVLRPNVSGRIRPFFTIGYLDYYFKGNNRYDNDAIKSFSYGGGIDFYTKKGKCTASLGVKFGSEDDTGFVIFYFNLVALSF